MTTPLTAESASNKESRAQGALLQTFATPVARIPYHMAADVNEELAGVLLARLSMVENQFTYKSETAADMTSWGEPLIDGLTSWVLRMARRFAETAAGKSLDDAFVEAQVADQSTFNGAAADRPDRRISVVSGRSWASIYRSGDHHESHFHPNTAIAAIYYVEAPETCDLDLIDPRPNIDYYDPGISFAGEGRNFRMRCAPGELVLFPGWLKHSVPRFHDDGVRISMSWNLRYAITGTNRSE